MHPFTLARSCDSAQRGQVVSSVSRSFGAEERVGMDVGLSALPGSPGEFGWAGAAKTYYWVDPVEELVAVILTQHMIGFDLPEADFQAVVYQSIED